MIRRQAPPPLQRAAYYLGGSVPYEYRGWARREIRSKRFLLHHFFGSMVLYSIVGLAGVALRVWSFRQLVFLLAFSSPVLLAATLMLRNVFRHLALRKLEKIWERQAGSAVLEANRAID